MSRFVQSIDSGTSGAQKVSLFQASRPGMAVLSKSRSSTSIKQWNVGAAELDLFRPGGTSQFAQKTANMACAKFR